LVQARVHHFQESTGVVRFFAVEEEICFRRVPVAAVGIALEHAERHKSVKKIAHTA
jgi:hypothetical protein